MKSKTVVSENVQGRKNFKFAWVFNDFFLLMFYFFENYLRRVSHSLIINDNLLFIWSFRLGTQNGIEIEQVGKLKPDNKTLVVKGSYSYTGADGRRYRVRYTADELGFHPITELEVEIPDIVTTTKNPFSKSNFPNKRYLPPSNAYLPPSNTYLPPSNTYLPPSNVNGRNIELPYNTVWDIKLNIFN